MNAIKAIKVLCFILGSAACFAALLMAFYEIHDQAEVTRLVEEWRKCGPHSTIVGSMRQRLASSPWLGPLRPAPARDPLAVCSHDWLRVPSAKQHLSCLRREMDIALHEHVAFTCTLMMVLVYAGLAVLLAIVVQPYRLLIEGIFPWDTLPTRLTTGPW